MTIKCGATRVQSELFDIYINGLDEEVEGMVIRFTEDRKLDGVVNALEGRNKIQNEKDGLMKWAGYNRRKYNSQRQSPSLRKQKSNAEIQKGKSFLSNTKKKILE